MSTADIVELSEPHAPKEASIKAFEDVLLAIKHELIKVRHNHDKHEPEYFARVSSLSNEDLVSFTSADLETVRVGDTAYGIHLLGAVKLPALDDAYIHVRIFVGAKEGTDGSSVDEREAKLHSLHTEEVVKEDGDHVYRAIFRKADKLEWFET